MSYQLRPKLPGSATVLVAIDGPAGSGKSSVAKAAAAQLGFGMLDTGAAYRALAYVMLAQGKNLDDACACADALDKLHLDLPLQPGGPVLAGRQDLSQLIRTPEIVQNVSRVSQHPVVRDTLNRYFRERVAHSQLAGVVMEGRDITTVVAPDAQVRLILTADQQVRAARRHRELPQQDFAAVLADLQARDARDLRVVNFVDPAPGVQLIDTTRMDFAESVAAVVAAVAAAQKDAVV